MLSDYNCRILDIDRYKLYLGDPSLLAAERKRIKDDIAVLGNLGFHKLICQVRHDTNVSVDHTKKVSSSLKRFLKEFVFNKGLSKFKLSIVHVLYLSEDAPYIKNIRELAVSKTNYIFIELPLIEQDHVPLAINKILYQCKLIPIFTEFHTCTALYDLTEVNKLINIKNAAFQFSLKSAVLPNNISHIKRILRNGNTVLIGSSCDHSNFNKVELKKNLTMLQKLLGNDYYMTLVMRARSFIM